MKKGKPGSMQHHSKKAPRDIIKAAADGGSYMTANFVGNHNKNYS
jgi:hypothetical protein